MSPELAVWLIMGAAGLICLLGAIAKPWVEAKNNQDVFPPDQVPGREGLTLVAATPREYVYDEPDHALMRSTFWDSLPLGKNPARRRAARVAGSNSPPRRRWPLFWRFACPRCGARVRRERHDTGHGCIEGYFQCTSGCGWEAIVPLSRIVNVC